MDISSVLELDNILPLLKEHSVVNSSTYKFISHFFLSTSQNISEGREWFLSVAVVCFPRAKESRRMFDRIVSNAAKNAKKESQERSEHAEKLEAERRRNPRKVAEDLANGSLPPLAREAARTDPFVNPSETAELDKQQAPDEKDVDKLRMPQKYA